MHSLTLQALTDPHSEDTKGSAVILSDSGVSCVALGPWKEARAQTAVHGEGLPSHPSPGARLESRARSCQSRGGREQGEGGLGVPPVSKHTVMLDGHHAARSRVVPIAGCGDLHGPARPWPTRPPHSHPAVGFERFGRGSPPASTVPPAAPGAR